MDPRPHSSPRPPRPLACAQVRTIRNDALAKKKVKNAERLKLRAKKEAKIEAHRQEVQKAQRKRRYTIEGQAAAKAKKRARLADDVS